MQSLHILIWTVEYRLWTAPGRGPSGLDCLQGGSLGALICPWRTPPWTEQGHWGVERESARGHQPSVSALASPQRPAGLSYLWPLVPKSAFNTRRRHPSGKTTPQSGSPSSWTRKPGWRVFMEGVRYAVSGMSGGLHHLQRFRLATGQFSCLA